MGHNEDQARYYDRNRNEVLARRVMLRMYRSGSIPNAKTVQRLDLKVERIIAAFSTWVLKAKPMEVWQQRRRLNKMLARL